MKPTIEILAKISQNSSTNKEEVFTRLYRYLLRQDIYFIAYQNLYANSGAATKGVNGDTADSFSEDKINKIIKVLTDETYQPNPVRRTYITKSNGKQRPLGIPTFTDKLVQEVLRMILEAVYEPVFLQCSHGFRPKRSCHTALRDIKYSFTGTKWFIEGDIKGCFDNIDHTVLVGIINNKIKDAKIIKLIYKFLKAGYMENWQYNNTYSGTPQGGIISPLLSNIYLHELDKFMMNLKSEFDKKSLRRDNAEYVHLAYKVRVLRNKIGQAENEQKQELLKQLKEVRAKMLKTPAKSQTDKKLLYVRYADDFLIAINGNREDCVALKDKISDFISETLKMQLSNEKTLITHSSQKARFLGYDVKVRRNNKLKNAAGYTKRTLLSSVDLSIPFIDKINRFLFNKGAVKMKNGEMFSIHRPSLLRLTELEIITAYNAEVRGLCNYYNMASDYYRLNYFVYLMEYSCLKTLANKHKSTISKIINKYRHGKNKWAIPYETKNGRSYRTFIKLSDCKNNSNSKDELPNTALLKYSTTTFDKRLKAKQCELCGTTESERYEIHHINKVKNLKGKQPWEIYMIAKQRKTIVVCKNCHLKIHKR